MVGAPRPKIYGRVREEIHTGDLFMFSGNGFGSEVIRWASHSDYSHVGIAAWWKGNLMVIQADSDGIEARPVSEKIYGKSRAEIDRSEQAGYAGIVDWFRVKDLEPGAPQRDELLDAAISLLGGDFATLGLARVFFHTVRGNLRGQSDFRGHPSAMFCSQFVSAAMRKAKWPDPAADIPDHLTSPEHIVTCGLYEFGARIHTRGASPRTPAPEAEQGEAEAPQASIDA